MCRKEQVKDDTLSYLPTNLDTLPPLLPLRLLDNLESCHPSASLKSTAWTSDVDPSLPFRPSSVRPRLSHYISH